VYVRKYSCRTDAIMIRFSECNDALRLHSEDLQPLTYCNEMRYLDLGHNYISDAFFVAYMPELEVCILAVETQLTDISALANCPKLEYLEIFTGKVTDLSPLANCKNLKHLNISRNKIRDLSPLFELDLERLWLAGNPLPYSQIQEFLRRFPNCQVDNNIKVDPAATWRFKGKHLVPRYQLLRKQFCYDMMQINTYSAFDDPNQP
jgi:Leucine-rich repeat (LRR) protein